MWALDCMPYPSSAYGANRNIVFMTLPLLALSTYFYGAPCVHCALTAAFTAMLCDHLVAWLRAAGPCDKTENSSIPLRWCGHCCLARHRALLCGRCVGVWRWPSCRQRFRRYSRTHSYGLRM